MTDHYADARERHERELLEKEAARRGLSVEETRRQQIHEEKMRLGRQAHQQLELAEYYRRHSK